MRNVAAELDTAATSLYRHVASREALLLAMLEQVAADLPVEVPGDTPGERLLTRIGAAHDYMAENVWVLHILIRGELVAEGAFGFTDACLADFLAAGLSPERASVAYRACWHLTIGELLENHPLTPPREPSQRSAAMRRLDPARLPAMAHVRGRAARDTGDDYRTALATLVGAFLQP